MRLPSEEEDEEDEVQVAKRFVPEYVEWEAVCTCRWEWENYPLQWSGSTDPDEKALFELIVIDYIPILSEVFRVRPSPARTSLPSRPLITAC